LTDEAYDYIVNLMDQKGLNSFQASRFLGSLIPRLESLLESIDQHIEYRL
jgi:hypothetical protein